MWLYASTMSDYEHLDVSTADHVTTVRLNRPETLNALNQRLTGELTELVSRLGQDDATRAVVLTGAGRGFCAGADVAELAAAGQLRPAGVRRRLAESAEPLSRALLELEKPIVAAVNGPCAGAGVGIALSCDFVLAADDAFFALAFVRRGLVPDYATTWLLPRLVGLRKARELCLLGERLSADEADRLGLLTRVVPGEDLLAEAAELAGRLARGPGVALRLTKRLLADSLQADHRNAIDAEFTAQTLCFTTSDAIEGAQAFLEKRDPVFTSS
jgi:2-(1,2-epoxy-1,2-dihydrophenyl)acetyl-CoA isomerase